jgi:pyruvate kinase
MDGDGNCAWETSVGYPFQLFNNDKYYWSCWRFSTYTSTFKFHVRTKRFINNKSICYHAAVIANDINAKVLPTLTNSGYVLFKFQLDKKSQQILVFTSKPNHFNTQQISGVKAFFYDKFRQWWYCVNINNKDMLKRWYVIGPSCNATANKGMQTHYVRSRNWIISYIWPL